VFPSLHFDFYGQSVFQSQIVTTLETVLTASSLFHTMGQRAHRPRPILIASPLQSQHARNYEYTAEAFAARGLGVSKMTLPTHPASQARCARSDQSAGAVEGRHASGDVFASVR